MATPGLPKPDLYKLEKSALLESLARIDGDAAARKRVSDMAEDFRKRIDAAVASLPETGSTLQRLGTSPYVLAFYSRQNGFTRISELEERIAPAKAFSSMETSAGRMIEQVALPVYGWECVVDSEMQTANSTLDGRKIGSDAVEVATLKSGPRCLNDGMTDNFSDAILNHAREWAADGGADHLKFTYGALYGTRRQSNKKDWHILRKISEKAASRGGEMLVEPAGRWDCSLTLDGGRLRVDVAVRIGMEWWRHLGEDCAVELWTALIQACIDPGEADWSYPYSISDLGSIISTNGHVPDCYEVSLLQESQIPWLFLLARHFCDVLI
jgi:hypothetical protein